MADNGKVILGQALQSQQKGNLLERFSIRSIDEINDGGDIDFTRELLEKNILDQIYSDATKEIFNSSLEFLDIAGGNSRTPSRAIPINGNIKFDSILNMIADPLGLLGTVPANLDIARQVSQANYENAANSQLKTLQEAIKKQGGSKNIYADGSQRIDYERSIDKLLGQYETIIENKRLVQTWGENYKDIRIGKSQMTVKEFENKVYTIQQTATDKAYEAAMKEYAPLFGKEFMSQQVQTTNFATKIGQEVDSRVRRDLREFAKIEGILENNKSSIWAVNRRLKDTVTKEYGIPDNRVGLNLYLDTTIALKSQATPQLQRWNQIRSGNMIVVRPTQIGGSYGIPNMSFQNPLVTNPSFKISKY